MLISTLSDTVVRSSTGAPEVILRVNSHNEADESRVDDIWAWGGSNASEISNDVEDVRVERRGAIAVGGGDCQPMRAGNGRAVAGEKRPSTDKGKGREVVDDDGDDEVIILD